MGILVINVAPINFTNIQGILKLLEYIISCFFVLRSTTNYWETNL